MRRMAFEIELKFRIPPDRLAALRGAVATRSAQRLPLAAAYFDTAGEHLAHARVALRLRREGAQWVQTLKAQGAGTMQRLEHNVVLPGSAQQALAPGSARPALDIRRHDGTDAGARLRQVLADAGPAPLVERYATEVMRTRRVLRAGAARIELALDEGHISAGPRCLPICEIEFELHHGAPQALLAVAARWVDRFNLVLDVRSKSERGHWLAAGLAASPPAQARLVRLLPRASPAQAVTAMVAEALDQALANASQLADGNATPAHLHQLRVALRRLRSVMRVFGPLAAAGSLVALPGGASLLPAGDCRLLPPGDRSPLPDGNLLAPALAALFSQLGAARDADVMAEWLWPALRAAGAPNLAAPTALPATEVPDLAALLRAPATQRLWLAALASCQPMAAPASGAAGAGTALRQALAAPVQRLLRQVQRDALRFAELDENGRHRLRRRIKRLRYAAEGLASLWRAKAVAATLDDLQRAQTPLGEYHDTVMALAHCRTLAAHDPHAWFAVGWLSARRQALEPPCAKALARLARMRGFWRKA